MNTQQTFSLSLILFALASASCKKSTDPSAQPPASKSPTAQANPAQHPASDKPAESASQSWATMDRKQRKRYMGKTILPEMAKLFQGFNAKQFANFTCQTCHGSNWTDPSVDFKMPNNLYPLPKDNPIQAAMDYNPEITAFMQQQVVPNMARLLGKTPYDPATGTGDFGCFNCHASE